MSLTFDRNKTLEELAGQHREAQGFVSHMKELHPRLFRKPLSQFTTEDLRSIIAEDVELAYLIPLAVEVLEQAPLKEGNSGPCALLRAVLLMEPEFWQENPKLWWRTNEIVMEVESLTEKINEEILPALELFRQGAPQKNTG